MKAYLQNTTYVKQYLYGLTIRAYCACKNNQKPIYMYSQNKNTTYKLRVLQKLYH